MDCLKETDGLICMFMCRTEGVGAGSIPYKYKATYC